MSFGIPEGEIVIDEEILADADVFCHLSLSFSGRES